MIEDCLAVRTHFESISFTHLDYSGYDTWIRGSSLHGLASA